MKDIEQILDKYYNWLRDKTAWKSLIKDWTEITTPYLDRHNDYIQIYLKKDGENFLLTDDSYTINDLENEGCSLESKKRQKLLTMTLNGFGVQKDQNNALFVNASPDNFSLKKHNLIQAILAVNDLFYLAAPHVSSLFFEDVRTWLDAEDIRYSERVSFTGHSGYGRLFEFLIPKSKEEPERIIKLINRPERSNADALIMSWLDTKEERPKGSKAFAFVNDNERRVPNDVEDALKSYQILPVLWSQRNQVRDTLAA
jgi:hypothetical protein